MAIQRDKRGAPAHIMGPRIILLLSVLALMLIGFVMIYSTSAVITLAKAGTEVAVDPMAETLNQIKFAVAGVILALIIWKFVPVSLWRSNAVWVIWAVAFALLVITAVAGGCTIMIAFQAFLNIAMVIGWFPVVGKPLPFISSGGSSLVAMLIMVGIILSVSRGAEAPTIYDRRRADLRVVRATNGAPPPSRGGRSSSSRGRR